MVTRSRVDGGSTIVRTTGTHRAIPLAVRRLFSAFVLLLLAPSSRSAELDLSPLQAQVMIKTLAYDRALPTRTGRAVFIGLLFGSTKQDSARVQFETLQAFERAEGTRVLGRPVVVSSHMYKDAAVLSAWIADKKIGAVYVAPGLAGEVGAIRAVCAERKVASLTAARSLVEGGVAIGVVAKGTVPSIVVNLPAAQSSGMDLDSKLLSAAEVLR